MAVPRHLRYSPVNWLIVDWSFNGKAFDNCGLPTPAPCEEPEEEEGPAACRPLPVQEAINTYDWERWLPEVIVGIEEPDEEIAANYVRQATIEFAKGARVLQREVVVELQPGVDTYPVFPYVGEQIIGVIAARVDNGDACLCNGCSGMVEGVEWRLDVARNELTIPGCLGCGLLRVLVYAAPTEDTCAHDVFLYDRFRADITLGARLMYANAMHFRDRALMNSLPTNEAFTRAIVLAKTKAVRLPSAMQQVPGSGMWGGSCCSVPDEQRYIRRS